MIKHKTYVLCVYVHRPMSTKVHLKNIFFFLSDLTHAIFIVSKHNIKYNMMPEKDFEILHEVDQWFIRTVFLQFNINFNSTLNMLFEEKCNTFN